MEYFCSKTAVLTSPNHNIERMSLDNKTGQIIIKTLSSCLPLQITVQPMFPVQVNVRLPLIKKVQETGELPKNTQIVTEKEYDIKFSLRL